MIVNTEMRGPQHPHHRPLNLVVPPALVRFCDDDQFSSGFQDPQNFAHVLIQIGPVVLSLDCCDEIKVVFWKRQVRYGGLPNANSTGFYQHRVFSLRCRDATVGVVNSADETAVRDRGQLLNCSTAAATNVENCIVALDGDMPEPPGRHRGVALIHRTEKKAADYFAGSSCLAQDVRG